jgi:hypothetical protein
MKRLGLIMEISGGGELIRSVFVGRPVVGIGRGD